MTIFFHAATIGFYDTRVHGERTVWIADPHWNPPQISVPDPVWQATEGAPKAKTPNISLPDQLAEAPLIEVPNPNCALPPAGELLEISLDEYRELFAAQAKGKVIKANGERPVIVEAPELTWEQRKADYSISVQGFMNQKARDAGYDDLKTAISYADEPSVPRFQAQGQAFRRWRSLCLAYCYEQMTAIENRERESPSNADLVAELPALTLPD